MMRKVKNCDWCDCECLQALTSIYNKQFILLMLEVGTSSSYCPCLRSVTGALDALGSTCMHPFATYVLRSYYKATGWNEDNLYANFTRSSNGTSSSRLFHGRCTTLHGDAPQPSSTSPSLAGCISQYRSLPTPCSRRRIR